MKYPFPRAISNLNVFVISDIIIFVQIRNHVTKTYNIPINDYLKEIIVGELLGDGNLSLGHSTSDEEISLLKYKKAIATLQGFQTHIPADLENTIIKFNEAIDTIRYFRMARLNFVMSVLAIPWAFHIKSIFEENGIPMSYKINDTTMMAARYHTVGVWSRFTVQLKDLYEQWYLGGKRIVPRNIKMSPNSLLHWFIGDGGLRPQGILLCTHGFSVNDVKVLV